MYVYKYSTLPLDANCLNNAVPRDPVPPNKKTVEWIETKSELEPTNIHKL